MNSLQDLLKQYDVPTESLAVGDKVLFERSGDSGSFSINLGEVKEIRPQDDFKEPWIMVKGIHTFFPDGSNQPHKGRVPWRFEMSYFNKCVTEHLEEHAQRLEKRAAEIRTWITTLEKS